MSVPVTLARRLLPEPVKRPLRRFLGRRAPVLFTIVLNWNNGSTDGSRDYIEAACRHANRHAVLLSENRGGDALNPVIARARAPYLHISENDIEYLAGWDRELLSKFEAFPELGQISPFAAAPEVEKGEIWIEKPATPLARKGRMIQVAEGNVGTSCIIRREVWRRGVRWRNIASSVFKFPDDGQFSRDVRGLRYLVAWNDRYVVFHWGCNIEEYRRHLPYYIQNYADKPRLGIEGFAARLEAHGYRLVKNDGGEYEIVEEQRAGG